MNNSINSNSFDQKCFSALKSIINKSINKSINTVSKNHKRSPKSPCFFLLQFESLPAQDEEELAAAAAAQDEPAKSTMKWSAPALKNPLPQVDVKTGTPIDRKEEALEEVVVEKKRKEKPPKPAVPDVVPEEKPAAAVEEHHGLLETVVSGVESMIGSVVGAVSGLLLGTGTSEEKPTEVRCNIFFIGRLIDWAVPFDWLNALDW